MASFHCLKEVDELLGARPPQVFELMLLALGHLETFEMFPLNLKISLRRARARFIHLPG